VFNSACRSGYTTRWPNDKLYLTVDLTLSPNTVGNDVGPIAPAEAVTGLGAGLGLVPALVIKALSDYLAHPPGGFGQLPLIVSADVMATVGAGLVGVLQAFLTNALSQGIMFDLRRQLFGRLMKQSVGFFTSSRTGDLLSPMNNDVGGKDVVSDTVFGLVSAFVTLSATSSSVRSTMPSSPEAGSRTLSLVGEPLAP